MAELSNSPLLKEVNERHADIYVNYRLKSMRYDYELNRCEIFLNFLPSAAIANHRQIEKHLEEILPNDCSYSYMYEKVLINKKSILECLSIFTEESLKFNIAEHNFLLDLLHNKVEILLPEIEYELAKSIGFVKQAESVLDESFCQPFSLTLSLAESGRLEIGEIKSYLDDGIAELMKKDDSALEVSARSYKVAKLEKYIGDIILEEAMYLRDAAASEDKVVFAGTVMRPEIITRTKKNDPQKEFTMCKFHLKDFTSAMECVIFANKSNLKKLEGISDKETIIASGYVNEGYNGALSFRINNLSYCELPEDLKENVYKKQPPSKYEIIFPTPYIETKQDDFFSIEKNIPLSLEGRTFVVIDTETTGVNPISDRITEVACVKIVNGKITETLTTLVNPKRNIPERVTQITGISDDMVANAPAFDKVVGDIMLFCKDAELVGHNVMFDINMLNNTADATHYYFDHDTLDTLEIAKRKIKSVKNYQLSTVAEKFGIINVDAHRALSDALVTAKLFIELSD